MSPEIFLGIMLTGFVPIVLLCMVAGAVLGMIVKTVRTSAERAVQRVARRPTRR